MLWLPQAVCTKTLILTNLNLSATFIYKLKVTLEKAYHLEPSKQQQSTSSSLQVSMTVLS